MPLLRDIAVLLLAVPLALPATSQPRPLRTGDTLPPLAGQTLTGHFLQLPAAAQGGQAVLILSFTRAAGQQEQQWVRQLTHDHAHPAIYSAIFLESVPRLFRSLALAGIRGGIPPALQARTMILYRDESLWKQRANLADPNHAVVLLLDPQGHIRWITSAAFTGSLCGALEQQMRASR